jgi:hypothetical protein
LQDSPFDSEQKSEHLLKDFIIFHLATPHLNKLASSRRNTRQNMEGKQTMPVSDPEKILKERGSLKPTNEVYQLKYPQTKAKFSCEPSNSHNSPPETINPTTVLFEVKS